jgi:hypothetical protein
MNSNQRRAGLAMASLTMGILSFSPCPGPLAGLPAIILGHRARLLARENPGEYAGAGMALAGLICGYVSTIAAIFFLWVGNCSRESTGTGNQLHKQPEAGRHCFQALGG